MSENAKRRPAAPRGLIGVVHLPALPGDPAYSGASIAEIEDFARRDAESLAAGGADALIVENFGSAPFAKGSPDDPLARSTLAILTRVALRCREASGLLCGVNCLRNDADAALAVAVAAELSFLRVNVHVGAMVTDQGIIEGRAANTLRERRRLDAEHTAICADVHVKHARPLAPLPFAEAVSDCVLRVRADAVIVTGVATGARAELEQIDEARAASRGRALVYVGSGVDEENVDRVAQCVDAAIVGTYLRGGDLRAPIDVERVRRLAPAFERCRPGPRG